MLVSCNLVTDCCPKCGQPIWVGSGEMKEVNGQREIHFVWECQACGAMGIQRWLPGGVISVDMVEDNNEKTERV